MAWIFSSKQVESSALAVVEDDEEESTASDSPYYCTSLVCTCGNDCHFNRNYHDQVTRFDPHAKVDSDFYGYASSTLGGKS